MQLLLPEPLFDQNSHTLITVLRVVDVVYFFQMAPDAVVRWTFTHNPIFEFVHSVIALQTSFINFLWIKWRLMQLTIDDL